MNALFLEYKNQGKFTKALLVGRNMVNKNPCDEECMTAYVDLLLFLADTLPSLQERKTFLGQASVTLSFYEENAELDEIILDNIEAYRERIGAIAVEIDAEESKKYQEELYNSEKKNENLIKQLFSIKQKLVNAKNSIDFDQLLKEISLVDAKIEHDYLTEQQKLYYDQLSKESTNLISTKMREFEHDSNVEYNKKAVEAYSQAFNSFKAEENKYKNYTQLQNLVSKTLFAFDASRLFNETLIYYNHVYSYIFGKLSDERRFDITKLSIECERYMR